MSKASKTKSTISALYVESGGSYYYLDGVDPWDMYRDARKYVGNNKIVAHPPCTRWSRAAALVASQKKYAHGWCVGDDNGCFAHALYTAKRCGGVIEHPYLSYAWEAYGIPKPKPEDKWLSTGDGGYTCYIEQGQYGHKANKPTWLLVYGVSKNKLPDLKFGKFKHNRCYVMVSGEFARVMKKRGTRYTELSKKEANHTPRRFRDLLISIARSAKKPVAGK